MTEVSSNNSELADDCPDTTTADKSIGASPAIQATANPLPIPTPHCFNMTEHPSASALRAALNIAPSTLPLDLLTTHLLHGLAYTPGSALGMTPPTQEACFDAFQVPNKVGLTAGARAWSKHAHRSSASPEDKADVGGYWGTPHGSVASINERAEALFWKVYANASWRNLHWLPHGVLVYEVRVPEGYGMRWAQDLAGLIEEKNTLREGSEEDVKGRTWMFRGFVEPMMEGGHEVGWRH